MYKTNIDLCMYIKNSRHKAGLTQSEVAHLLGYSTPQFVSNWERGYASVPLSTLRKLFKIYKMNLDHLLDLILKSERQELERKLIKRNR